jgi:hypothetical protein
MLGCEIYPQQDAWLWEELLLRL